MNENIYKYAGPDNFDKIFANGDFVTIKCSYPKNFNDPYELFLTIDFDDDPDDIAFYAEAVGEIPQLPTTCFSRSPSVVPMWAHYSQNHEGFAIEFDEAILSKSKPESTFFDITYQDNANKDLQEILYRASRIGKGRHVYLLQNAVMHSAYFTKTTCWGYELERRMVAAENDVRRAGDLLLIDLPSECVKSLICGPRASDELKAGLRAKAEEFGCNYYQLKIGRSTASPFFTDIIDNPHIFDGSKIEPCEQHCSSCTEPVAYKKKFCSWCQMDDSHRFAAAARNPYRIYQDLGLLDKYIDGMNEITRNFGKK